MEFLRNQFSPNTFRETRIGFGIGFAGEAGDLVTGTE
jgi:hypothetical protein